MRKLDSLPQNQQLCNPRHKNEYESRPTRKRTLLNGKLVYGDGAFTVDCTIRDISEGGAKITLSRHQSLPSDLFLIIVKYGIAYQAKAMWVNFPARGLRFLKEYPLNMPLPDKLKFLRHLWLNLSARLGTAPGEVQWEL
jgi:PilZ domain